MTDKFEMNQGLGHQLEMALDRNGWTRSLVNKATEGNFLASVLSVLEGRATIVPNKPLVTIAKAVSTLLTLVTTVSVASTAMPFIAKDKFVINTTADAEVKISGIGVNFQVHFLPKVEEAFLGSELRVERPSENSTTKNIIAGLGGYAKAETALTEMWALMEAQGQGHQGVLLTDNHANIFLIRDVNGVLWVVVCRWYSDGWDCDAYTTVYPYMWCADYQVFSRNSVTA